MKVQAILTPKAGKQLLDLEPHIVPEEVRLWQLYASDVVREMHFQADPIRVVLVLEVTNKSDAAVLLDSLPMVSGGMLDVDLIHLGPWLPLQALFGPQAGLGGGTMPSAHSAD